MKLISKETEITNIVIILVAFLTMLGITGAGILSNVDSLSSPMVIIGITAQIIIIIMLTLSMAECLELLKNKNSKNVKIVTNILLSLTFLTLIIKQVIFYITVLMEVKASKMGTIGINGVAITAGIITLLTIILYLCTVFSKMTVKNKKYLILIGNAVLIIGSFIALMVLGSYFGKGLSITLLPVIYQFLITYLLYTSLELILLEDILGVALFMGYLLTNFVVKLLHLITGFTYLNLITVIIYIYMITVSIVVFFNDEY